MTDTSRDDGPRIAVVRASEWNTETAQTPGSVRMSAVSAMNGIVSPIWGGIFVVEPSSKTGVHHHGKQDTIVYVLEGEALVRWGLNGEDSTIVRPGDFLHVPAWLPHQEVNPSNEHSFRWVVVRSTAEPIVINMPEQIWDSSNQEEVEP